MTDKQEPPPDEATQRLSPPEPESSTDPASSEGPATSEGPASSEGSASSEGPTVERPKREPVDLDGPTRRLSIPKEPAEPATVDVYGLTRPLSAPAEPDPSPDPVTPSPSVVESLLRNRPSPAGALILVLLALFGFTLVVQLRSNDSDEGLTTTRQEDLVRILSDLEARDSRLQSEISALETSQRQLTSGVAGRQAALEEAQKRADELGLLAGTLPGRGPGLRIVIDGVKASAVLNTVQELRGSGGEVMQISGADGKAVRIVASSYFVDAEGGGIIVDGSRQSGPYILTVIGVPQIMQTALQIPGGVVASVNSGGGSVTLEQRTMVEVTAVREAKTLQYARPAS